MKSIFPMYKFEIRSSIQFYFLFREDIHFILNKMIIAYGTGCIASNTTTNWFERFSNGDLYIEDKPWTERQIDQKSIKIVQRYLEDFPNISTYAILHHSNISKATVIRIFTEVLLWEKFIVDGFLVH
jgi:hypothetical protein